jgi:hypothetical protein
MPQQARVLDAEVARLKAEVLTDLAKDAKKQDPLASQAWRWYTWRNGLLSIGLSALIGARWLAASQAPPPTPIPSTIHAPATSPVR